MFVPLNFIKACGVLSTLFAASMLSQRAQATVITFDDLGPSPAGTLMPAVYNDLRWGFGFSDWHYMSLEQDPTNTFLALSGTGTFVGALLGGGDFIFDGADFWSRRGLDANGDFYFFLYNDGVTVYNGVDAVDGRQRFSGTHQAFSPNYSGPVDAFALYFDNDDWDHLAMDNLRIQTIPSPGWAGMMGVGAVVGLRRRR